MNVQQNRSVYFASLFVLVMWTFGAKCGPEGDGEVDASGDVQTQWNVDGGGSPDAAPGSDTRVSTGTQSADAGGGTVDARGGSVDARGGSVDTGGGGEDGRDGGASGSAPSVGGQFDWVEFIHAHPSGRNVARSVAVDSAGNAYVAGTGRDGDTTDHIGFLSKYDASGQRVWSTSGGPHPTDVDVAPDGSVYMVGYTGIVEEGFGGQTYHGGETDGFVAKFDSSGQRQWVRLIGTAGADRALGVTVGKTGEIYAGGFTSQSLGGQTYNGGESDGFVAKFDGSGRRMWLELLGTPGEERVTALAATASGGDVYAVGFTNEALGGGTYAGNFDGFLARLDPSGNRKWIELIGTVATEAAQAVAVGPNGHPRVAGRTNGDFGSRDIDGAPLGLGFVAKFDPAGNRAWVRHLKTFTADERGDAVSVAVDGGGNTYVAGTTHNARFEQPDQSNYEMGESDGYVARFDSSGRRTMLRQFGSTVDENAPNLHDTAIDRAYGIAVGGDGVGYVVGTTSKSFGGETFSGGARDGFIVSLD